MNFKIRINFRKCPNNRTRGTELSLACYTEPTACVYEQPIPTHTTEYMSLDQKTLQENHVYDAI